MITKTRVVGDVHIIELAGRFEASTISSVAPWLEQVTSTPAARVLVNLAQTIFIDSTALALLVQSLKRVQQSGGELALCGMSRPVFMIFELTRLDKAFAIFVDEDHALQSLASMSR